MIFKHKSFILDDKSRKIFDENRKELYLTGNAYRVLVFLCNHGSATLTEIGDELDRMKDYNEDHIRQYRYKINSIIGSEVMKYENKIYLIEGLVEKTDDDSLLRLDNKNRNTDSLQSNAVKLEHMKTEIKPSFYPAYFVSALLLLSTMSLGFPYGYYTFVKLATTGATAYFAYLLYKSEKTHELWFWAFVILAVLFNPFTPVFLYSKQMWSVIDVVAVIILLSFSFSLKNKRV